MRLFGRIAIAVVLVVAAFGAAGAAFLAFWPSFGGTLTVERLARAQASPQFRDGHFENVIPKTPRTSAQSFEYLKLQMLGNEVRTPPPPCPPVVHLTREDFGKPVAPGLRAIWFGHASVYLEIDGARLMVDPMLSEYASPLARVGPKRFHPPPLALDLLPKMDAVLISHDHYDHLDMETTKHLARVGSHFLVPLGIGAHLERWGVSCWAWRAPGRWNWRLSASR
jgi:hypothetical protein